MHSIWFSLAWKEWHEHKWKLVSMVAILWGTVAFTLASHDLFGATIGLLSMCILPLAMFLGLGAAANERSRNTLPFLQSLPAPLWRVAVVKILFGLLSLFAAIALAIAFVYVWNELAGRDAHRWMGQLATVNISGIWFVDCFLWLAPFAVGMFAWAAAAGVNRRDEVSAGAMVFAVVIGWSLLLTLTYLVLARWFIDVDFALDRDKWKWLAVLGFSTLPVGTFFAHELSVAKPAISLALMCVATAVTYSLLLAWYVFRFNNVRHLDRVSRKTAEDLATKAEWLPGPRRSPISAIVWMEIREIAPIALAGFGASIGLTSIAALGSTLARQPLIGEILARVYPNTAIVFGFFVALVAGIGVCLNDVSPKINEFWRSRPIQPDAWFGIKFITGIALVLVSIYGPILFLRALGLPVFESWNTPDALLIPVMQVAVFAAAVATTCLLRHAVYAAILSIAVVYVGTLLGIAICRLPDWLHARPVHFFSDPGPARTAFGLVLSFAFSTLIAWLAMRNDWGRTSRN